MQAGDTSERPEQRGLCRMTWKHHVRGPAANLTGTCKHTLYIPLCNKSPYHRPHRTSSREKTCRTSHNATPARLVMAIKTSPYPQCKGGTFPDSGPHSPPSVARSGHDIMPLADLSTSAVHVSNVAWNVLTSPARHTALTEKGI